MEPSGPAGPTFELGHIFFNFKKIVTFLKSTVYTILRQISSNRKIATDCDSGIQPTHLGYNNC